MRIGRLVLYPFLIAPYPAIAIYAHNANRAPASQVVWPIVLMTAAASLIWGALRLAVRNSAKAGLLTVVILAFFNTASQAHEWVDKWLYSLSWWWVVSDVHVWPPLIVTSEFVAAVALGRVALMRLSNPDAWTPRLNLFSLLLIVMPLCNLVVRHAREPATAGPPLAPSAIPFIPAWQSSGWSKPPEKLATPMQPSHRPDIYYIILDAYVRSDVMLELFGFDNEPFLERLERKGFYIVRDSTANYCQTPLSISSSLNAVYLNGLIPPTSQYLSPLGAWIGGGAVVETFRGLGYRFVTFATGFGETEHPEADVYLSDFRYLSPFHQFLVSRTAPACLLPSPRMRDGYTATRERTMFLLATAPQVARWREPTFTFAHVLAPHPPFVFGAHGEDVSPHHVPYSLIDNEDRNASPEASERYAFAYRNEAIFLTREVELMIDGILKNSPEPPIIILQSDHGSGMRLDTTSVARTDLHERMSILNAYYLPGRGSEHLYQSISPVNSFRVVFNNYFGAKLEMLPDRSYYSTWGDPFQFIDVTDQLREPRVPGPSAFSALTGRSVNSPAVNTPSHDAPPADLRRREAGP